MQHAAIAPGLLKGFEVEILVVYFSAVSLSIMFIARSYNMYM